ncbi:MAG TPA: carbamate kinase [Methanoregulaceae archaeon]|nr:carbamate kinase [Methanoregulaceae archaeon]
MRIVVALGGNALLRRGQPLTAEVQRRNIRTAVAALAPAAKDHQLILTHGNGPQIGLLASEQAAYQDNLRNAGAREPALYPFDILGAETEGMIGYVIEQELGNLLEGTPPLATILTMVDVDPMDPAFKNPTKFIGPGYGKEEAVRIGKSTGWTFKQDNDAWRRVVPSPKPRCIREIRPIEWLLEKGTLVICTGGGGIPVTHNPGRKTVSGVEAVIDKDLASGLLAQDLSADRFIMVTDVPGVYLNFGTPSARLLEATTPGELRKYRHHFPAGSMGPKVAAACEFVKKTGREAVIGSLEDLSLIFTGQAGTVIRPGAPGPDHSNRMRR